MYILIRITKVEKEFRTRTRKIKINAIITITKNEYLLHIVHSQHISILIIIRITKFKIKDIIVANEKEFEIIINIEKRILNNISETSDT